MWRCDATRASHKIITLSTCSPRGVSAMQSETGLNILPYRAASFGRSECKVRVRLNYYTEVCRLVVHRRGQMGSGSQVLN